MKDICYNEHLCARSRCETGVILKHGTPSFRLYTNDIVGNGHTSYSETTNGHGYSSSLSEPKNGREQGQQQAQYGQGDDNAKKTVVCYFSNWAHERPVDSFIPENLQGARGCTHVFYAFATLDPRSLVMAPSHRYTDVNQGYLGEGT